ncbi:MULTISPECIES: hypothetical protein [unclassified Paenibacillus]|uniref:hypothetical protein n=1 Tax=unclassified Paenibacillus TaxID=185978 RepID=UPI001AEA5579|nr:MULTISPECIES: hypothetical protein [unclassified Paenibacillus]MBP1155791.1 hypothetical protein [Paenibacillus sp. PvP091]MBP1168823.1 hypothetical protein [Paenibacillus sp. PvR098]MBP2439851.1 hypothetical protein [Paenibacillus sp. PvP052]
MKKRLVGRKTYISVYEKFIVSHMFSWVWLLFSVWISQKSILELGQITGIPFAILIIAGIAYIPGYMNSFLVSSLLLDRQPPFKHQASVFAKYLTGINFRKVYMTSPIAVWCYVQGAFQLKRVWK